MSLVSNERIKLSAADSNTAAGGLFTATGGLFTATGGLFTATGGLFTATGGLFTAGGVAPLVAVAFLDLRADRTGP